MTKGFNETEEEMIEKVVKLFEMQGFNPTVMRIYISIFLSTKPIGMQEISKKTGYSISTVCNTLEIIERTMDIRKFKKPGSKKIYYECIHDLVLAHRKKMESARQEAKAMIQILTEAEDLLKEDKSPEAIIKRANINRLRHSYEKFHEMCHKFEDMIESIKT
jgi:DNA-binding transcriptional regulator GbsR (MarR family)